MTETNVVEVAYVPETLVTIEIDQNAQDFIKGVYEKWLANQGAKVAAQKKAEQENEAKKAELTKSYEAQIATLDKESAKLAKDKNWAGIAANEAKKATLKTEYDKQIAKLNGVKVHTSGGSKSGQLEVVKLSEADLRGKVFQFSYINKSYVVTHTSNVNSATMKEESDKWLVQECQPVKATKNADGSKRAEGIPTLVGKPFSITVVGAKGGALTHSAFENGVYTALLNAKVLTGSAGSAKQPWANSSEVVGAEYTWLVVKA